jgi:hypothetical protein
MLSGCGETGSAGLVEIQDTASLKSAISLEVQPKFTIQPSNCSLIHPKELKTGSTPAVTMTQKPEQSRVYCFVNE